MALDIQITPAENGTVNVALIGRLDAQTASDCQATIEPVLTAETKVLAFNLAKLDYISSAGLRIFLEARKTLAKTGGKVTVSNMQAPVAKVFDIADIISHTDVFDTEESADIYLDAVQRKERVINQDITE
jgi:anti-sigma B factor antagonist